MELFKYADTQQAELYKRFPKSHFLSNPQNLDHVYLWTTFFRRNLHRYATDYLGIKLHLFQVIILYFMGISSTFAEIACRAATKTFVVSVFSLCYGGLYPYGQTGVSSGYRSQADIIITGKIKNELMPRYPMIKKEIEDIVTTPDTVLTFKSKATIKVIANTERGRSNRTNVMIRDEFRLIRKQDDDGILSPCQIIRQPAYLTAYPYSNEAYQKKWGLQETPKDIYISSSWLDNGHWMWDLVDKKIHAMLSGDSVVVLAFDESIPLKHNIKTQKQLRTEHDKQDPLTWRIEFLNERVKENTSALFTYKTLMSNQCLKKPFYPLQKGQIKKKPYNTLEKMKGEVRIVSCDMAFIAGKDNDNSVFSCIRAIPETTMYEVDGELVERLKGYKRVVPYLESQQGGELEKQAIRIRQLYEDFNADYIVLDGQNNGLGIYEYLAKPLYDTERDIEYSPLACVNDENFQERIDNPNAKPAIFIIRATEKDNSIIAIRFKEILDVHKIDLLVNLNTAKEEILGKTISDYSCSSSYEEQLYFEKPFLETQLFISETANLSYNKNIKTGAIVVREQGKNTKDRYTSVSYGSYFIGLLEKDLFVPDVDEDITQYESCVGVIDF